MDGIDSLNGALGTAGEGSGGGEQMNESGGGKVVGVRMGGQGGK